mgnify:CR=1 FL=1
MNPEWIDGLIGGLIIGIAASAFLLINGRILGASGILGGLVDLSGRSNAVERLSFLIGLICGIALWFLLFLLLFSGIDFLEDTHINGIPLEETTCWTSTNCD